LKLGRLRPSFSSVCDIPRYVILYRGARHGAVLGGESPLHAVEVGSASLGKGVHREVESEGSR
jgi:hypothetical protein